MSQTTAKVSWEKVGIVHKKTFWKPGVCGSCSLKAYREDCRRVAVRVGIKKPSRGMPLAAATAEGECDGDST